MDNDDSNQPPSQPRGQSWSDPSKTDARDAKDSRDDSHRDADGISESLRQRLEALVPELVRKTFSAGMGAVFHTEDSIRKVAKEVNLPNVAGYLASSADATKDKVLEVIARETREFLEHINLSDEIAKLLTTLSLEVKTEIRFIPNSERYGGAEPDVKSSVRIKRTTESGSGAAGAEPDDKSDKAGERDDKDRSRLRFWKRDSDET
jgi:hypothetical protein